MSILVDWSIYFDYGQINGHYGQINHYNGQIIVENGKIIKSILAFFKFISWNGVCFTHKSN
ncbi:hypothetical protein JOC86_004108 [Bacillus pakistanensis]|uniref:Uncharacterized protein n=1 Tax=Rossellomorea pakistanensis TaxID=992288 RepID=A0ABS2NI40_9BACI|nr:hypothetical protein [Bacillus pakistanensis]